MLPLVTSLSRSLAIRRLSQFLRLNKVGNWYLRHFPVVRRLPASDVIYRATRLESLVLADEIFQKGNLYDAALLPDNFTNFADLGSNVGYFTCWLAHLARGRKLRGLMLDANPAAVAECAWHAQTNGLTEVHALHGIVGEGTPGDRADFFLYESNVCSMSQMPDTAALKLNGEWTKISVPCVSLAEAWRRQFGPARCHLLKVDIEGSEMKFLQNDAAFFPLVDAMLVEWHKWAVSFDELDHRLQQLGFQYIKTVEEGPQMGTAYFRRRATA